MEKSDITFIEETHEYYYTKDSHLIRIPGVHEIMEYAGYVNTTFVPEEALKRGEFVHAAVELIHLNEFDYSTVPPEWTPFISAYEMYLRDHDPTIVEMEELFLYFDEDIAYCGRRDRILDGGILEDVKTGTFSKWHPIQLAAYCGRDSWTDVRNVYLFNNGDYRVRPLKEDELRKGWKLFQYAAWKWWYDHKREWNKLQKVL